MSVRALLGLTLLSSALVIGCGDSLKPGEPGPGSDGGGDTPGSDMAGRDSGPIAMQDMRGQNMPGSPNIVVTSPAEGSEIAGDTLTVTATITPTSNMPVDANSVIISITPPGKGVVTAAMHLTPTANVFTGSISLADVPSGKGATFTVTAASTGGLEASVTVTYTHDHGPVIQFYQPTDKAVKGTFNVEFTVDDTLYPITDISKVSAGIRTQGDVQLTVVPGATPFRVTALVDATKFNPELDGNFIITARATNSKGTVGTGTQKLVVDNAGPIISDIKPIAGSYVGGTIQLSATIQDKDMVSEVNKTTVVVVFGNDPTDEDHVAHLTAAGNNSYVGEFDVGKLSTSFVLPTVSVRADDVLGNHTEVAHTLIVDNTRPWVSMDQRTLMRVAKLNTQKQYECSQLFSPLGTDVAVEAATVPQVFTLRARAEDHGNWAPGLKVIRYSSLSPTQAPKLFAIPDNRTTPVPLAVDTDNDGFCDDVNPDLLPTTENQSGQALSLVLTPITKAGAPDYTKSATVPAGCDVVGEDNFPGVDLLCQLAGTTMYYTVPYPDEHYVNPIFTIPPIGGDEAGCVGFQFDSLNNLPEGPTCFVTRAVDFTGNVNVSFPLHLCIDRGGGKCPSGWYDATSCTGKWDKVQKKIVAGTCTEGPTFPRSTPEIRYLGK
jgi:hypothetical protein